MIDVFNMKTLANIDKTHFSQLLHKFGIEVCLLPLEEDIPGSYWGAPEAGIILNQLFVRPDTPVHSALHESCHYICMDSKRRGNLHTDTGGDYDEENAVCFLQIILADFVPGLSKNQLCNDMDEWGYTFRLGSAARWFNEDATDALNWLNHYNILDSASQPTWAIRD
ncbi:MAG TPA: hypothetical protein ENK06_06920 [Gammaproteobacteria bacterium]|nr:hypothetical protein [Gammaproteobacteria bacterium]